MYQHMTRQQRELLHKSRSTLYKVKWWKEKGDWIFHRLRANSYTYLDIGLDKWKLLCFSVKPSWLKLCCVTDTTEATHSLKLIIIDWWVLDEVLVTSCATQGVLNHVPRRRCWNPEACLSVSTSFWNMNHGMFKTWLVTEIYNPVRK